MAKENLEQHILKAAEQLFTENGFDATSTTDIAKQVGCNQALVHYYFRTKEKLFEQIFEQKMQIVMAYIHEKQQENEDFQTALYNFIDGYFEILWHNPKLPFFIVKELIMNEERRQRMREKIISDSRCQQYYAQWKRRVGEEIAAGRIRPIDTLDLLLDVISLMVFTFVSLPLYSDFFMQNEEQMERYVQQRKDEIKTLVINGLRA